MKGQGTKHDGTCTRSFEEKAISSNRSDALNLNGILSKLLQGETLRKGVSF